MHNILLVYYCMFVDSLFIYCNYNCTEPWCCQSNVNQFVLLGSLLEPGNHVLLLSQVKHPYMHVVDSRRVSNRAKVASKCAKNLY